MKLTLLTATGCRPQAWAITERWAQAQDFDGEVDWIIVDDGEEPQPITFKRDGWRTIVVRPQPYWQPGQNTQARNLAAGLKLVEKGSRLVIWEDDDYMHPAYLRTVHRWLDTHDLVGEAPARYYNIKSRRALQLKNKQHASLCCTAMKGKAIEAFARELVPGVQFIDMNLWRNFYGTKALYPTKLVVGLKGLPGRTGIGMGHKPDMRGDDDPNLLTLKDWIGEEAAAILPL